MRIKTSEQRARKRMESKRTAQKKTPPLVETNAETFITKAD